MNAEPATADRITVRWLLTRLSLGTTYIASSAFIARALNALTSLVVARHLGAANLGVFGLLQQTVGAFTAVGALGLGVTANRFIARNRHIDPPRAALILALVQRVGLLSGVVASGVLMLSAPWLSIRITGDSSLTRLFAIGAPCALLASVSSVQLGALVGFEAFARVALVVLAGGVATFLGTSAGAVAGGVEGAVIGQVAGLLCGCVTGAVLLGRVRTESGLPRVAGSLWQELPTLWAFSIPALLCTIAVTSTQWICAALLASTPSGLAELGVYSAAYQLCGAVVFLPIAFGNAGFPVLSSVAAEGTPTQVWRLVYIKCLVAAGVALTFSLVLAAVPNVLGRIYGPGFQATGLLLGPVLILAIFIAAGTILWQALAAMGRMWWLATLNAAAGLVTIALTWQWRVYGAIGIASAAMAAQIFMVGVQVVLVSRAVRGLADERVTRAVSPAAAAADVAGSL
jgi:O-antigen/teichoic acid export membrane protein